MKGTLNTQTIVGHVGKVNLVGKIAEVAMAVNSSVTEKTEWFDVKIITASLVKMVTEHVKKGQLIYVSGETYTERWNDRDGVEKTRKRVLARSIEILNWDSSKAEKKEKADKPEGGARR